MTLGSAIKSLRVAAGHSQQDFAGLVGISPSYLSLIERDLRDPPISLVRLMAKHLGAPAAVLFAVSMAEESGSPSDLDALRPIIKQLFDATALNVGQIALTIAAKR